MALALRAVLGLAAALASCNQYDQLPAARCRSAAHCLPGQACRDGTCRSEGVLEVVVGARSSVNVAAVAVAAAAGGFPFESSRARLLRVASVRGREGVARVAWGGIPRLPILVVAWTGDASGPCAGDLFTAVPAPTSLRSSLRIAVTEPWRDDCFSLPPPLGYADNIIFPRALRARSNWELP